MKVSRPLVGLVLAAAAGLGGYAAWRHFSPASALPDWVAQSNGRIEMTRTDVAVKYPGRLVSLNVHEGDMVRPGQIIAEQDDTDLLAQLDGARAARERALGGVERAQGERNAHESQVGLARLALSETSGLHDRALVSDVELRQRGLALTGAQGSVAAASGGIAEARGAVAQAEAQIRQVGAALNDLHIRAPGSGRVEYRIVEPGTMMAPGGKLVSLVNPEDVTLTIFLPANVASRVTIGDEAWVWPQGFAGALPARVSFVSGEAQFTPKFVETASERETLSYRVKLQIPAAVARRHAGVLKAGMTADGYVRTDAKRPWPRLTPTAP